MSRQSRPRQSAPPPSDFESKSRLVLGIGLLSIGLAWLLKLLWPVLVVVGAGAGGYLLWLKQYRRFLAYQQREDRLLDQFCYLLEHRQGRISSLEFAMHSRVDKRAAQRYLHSQAQSFGAFFERTVHGDITYIFNLAVVYSLEPAYAPPAEYVIPEYTGSGYTGSGRRQPTPAEVAWTYAQQSAAKPRQRMKPSARTQNTALPTVRGRAMDTSENVTTIDVSAVNE